MIFDVGRLCVKIAGRDAGEKCVVVEMIDDLFVVVDGATRRKKVNIRHLEPLEQTIDIKEKASHQEVQAAFKKLGLEARESKPRQAAAKPVKKRESQKAKKEVKKAAPKVEKKETGAEADKKKK